MVLPATSKVNSKGHLEIGGCDTVELARDFGTPLFIYDEETINMQSRYYVDAFNKLLPGSEVVYAGKAFMCLAICQLAHRNGLSLDVMSGGELYTAISAGFPVEKIYMHGNNKTSYELEMAVQAGVGRIIVDSFNELERIDQIAGKSGKLVNIYLRLTPGVEAHTHEYIQTGQEDSKFGFGLTDGVAVKAVETALKAKNIQLVGYHAHIGSQIFATQSFAKAVEVVMNFSGEVKEKTGFVPAELNLGGGLGIKYIVNDEPSTIEDYAKVIKESVFEQSKTHGLPVPKIRVEPGRSIVGNAAVTVYTVGTIKKIPKIRTFISVDGGMSDNLRPMLYQAKYEALLANKANAKLIETVTIAGKHCESGDILIENVKLPSVEVGDLLCTPTTGAYGYAMANNYNRQTRPAVALVKDGKAQLIIRRENYDDLIRLDGKLEI
jgi:diaminopimelate decarboxylase